MIEQRSLVIFEQSIKSKATRKNYKDHLDRFLKYTKLRDYDALTVIPIEQLQTLLEDYVIYLKKRVSPNSVGTYMTGVKHFFIMNRIKLYWDIIQKMYPERIKQSGSKAWTNQQIKTMLDYTPKKRNKAIIHFQASTGARVGIFDYPLQMKHLRDMEDNCKAVLLYADDKDEYWVFLTPEANQALTEYFNERLKEGEKFYPDTPVFRTTYRLGIEKTKQLSKNAVISMMFRIIRTAKIERIRVNRNFDIQMDHGFRKRFNTILKLKNEVNSNIAEKILGHSVKIPLDNTYLTPTLDKLFGEFRKAIVELTISDELRANQKTKMLENELSEKESLQKQLDQERVERKAFEKQVYDTLNQYPPHNPDRKKTKNS